MIGLGLSDMADLRVGNPFVFEAHETTIHIAAVPVLIGYVRVSKADGSQVLD